MSKPLSDFIREHRAELEVCIGRVIGHVPKTASCYCPKSGTDHYHDKGNFSSNEIRQWILNDEELYQWARSEGVRI